MRITILAFAILAQGCTTMTTKTPAARDHKTPVALGKPSISQRMAEQRLQKAQVASGTLAVQGGLVR